ncbi:hypothetical protein WJ970_05740 [Achromobacter xylosoxidans]
MSSHAQPLVPARSAVSLAWPAALALAALMGISTSPSRRSGR